MATTTTTTRPKIYLLHGWAYQLDAWRPVKAGLESLGWRVELLKIPGLTDQTIDRPWLIDDYVSWLGQKLPASRPVILVGHSNGGRICLNYCQKTGIKQVEHLVLVASAGVPPRPWRRWRNWLVSSLARWLRFLKAVPGLSRVVYRFLGSGDYVQANPLMKQTLVNLLRSDYHLDVSQVKIPVSLIWGTADRTTPPWQAARLQRQLPGVVDTNLVSGAGHNLHRSHHQLLIKQINKQLQDLVDPNQ